VAVLTDAGDYVKLTIEEPYLEVTAVTGYSEVISGTGELKREFRWSISGVAYSSWVELSEDGLATIVIPTDGKLYMEYRYTLLSGGPVTVTSVSLEVTTPTKAKYTNFKPSRPFEQGGSNGLSFIDNFKFKPYQSIKPAVNLWKQLSNVISNMIGHDVMYCKATPQGQSADIVLGEWTLYDVEEPQCVKVIVPDNQFPDQMVNYNMFGADFQMPFEVLILREQFEKVFGKGVGPQKRDIVLFNFANNRFYEVGSSYLFSEFMQEELYYKVALVKYTPRSNVFLAEEVEDIMEAYTDSTDGLFNDDLSELQNKVTNRQQYTMPTTSRDPIRDYMHEDLVIEQKDMENYFTVVSRYNYQLAETYDPLADPLVMVQYNVPVRFPVSEDRTFSCWWQEKDVRHLSRAVASVEPDDDDPTVYYLTLAARLQMLSEGDLVEIDSASEFDGRKIIARVTNIDSIDQALITIAIQSDTLSVIESIYDWESIGDLKLKQTDARVLFNGLADSAGVRVEVLGSWIIVVTMNTTEYRFHLDEALSADTWYGMVLNLSNTFRQISLNVWTRIWLDRTSSHNSTSLLSIHESVMTSIEPEDRSNADMKYQIPSSPIALTNIRWMKQTIEPEQQTLFLNQQIVKDANLGIILDNALPQNKLPYMGNPK
jgi:hypothetical protein